MSRGMVATCTAVQAPPLHAFPHLPVQARQLQLVPAPLAQWLSDPPHPCPCRHGSCSWCQLTPLLMPTETPFLRWPSTPLTPSLSVVRALLGGHAFCMRFGNARVSVGSTLPNDQHACQFVSGALWSGHAVAARFVNRSYCLLHGLGWLSSAGHPP